MPIQKLTIICDDDGTELVCAGGYLSDSNSALIIYVCEECGKFYISNDGEFLDASWDLIEVDEAEALHITLSKNLIQDKE